MRHWSDLKFNAEAPPDTSDKTECPFTALKVQLLDQFKLTIRFPPLYATSLEGPPPVFYTTAKICGRIMV